MNKKAIPNKSSNGLVPLEIGFLGKPRFLTGFTIVELIVSIGIITAITSVVLYNYSSFNDNLALGAAGQEIAIAIREAQTYGISTKEASVGSGQFTYAYGIYFSPGCNPSNYYVFVDKNDDGVYAFREGGGSCGTPDSSSESTEKGNLRNNITISQICDINDSCPPSPSIKNLNITFKRPNPDAIIRFANSGGNPGSAQQKAKIKLLSPRGKILTIVIESSGQIYVQ